MSDQVVSEAGEDFWKLNSLSDVVLEHDLRELLAAGAPTEARIVAHLAEVEVRRLHLRAGYRSLFEYCLVALGFSEFEAVFRISAARTAHSYPVVFGMLARRDLHLSGLHLLRHHLTPENHGELLADARHKTKRQIEEQLAQRFPRPNVAATLRTLSVIEALAPGRYRLELTIGEAFKHKLERAAALLSHVNPSHDPAVVLERALDALAVQLNKGPFGRASRSQGVGVRAQRDKQTQSPNPMVVMNEASTPAAIAEFDEQESAQRDKTDERAPPPATPTATGSARQPPRSRPHIPRELSRQVADRDGHRCTFTAADGRRCSARAFLQIHHEKPWALGGPNTVENLRLLCAEHNRLLAEQDFGAAQVRHAIDRRGSAKDCGQKPDESDSASTGQGALLESDQSLPIPDKVA